ncbi:MAG TPA: class I SAM-dependent methyltransferase [Acidobacteriaceae bacterium]|nr:class I SAM-dependent methyltransferase [Acidobacteriaceae bacterium]
MSDVTRRSPYYYDFDPDGASTAARLSRLVGRGRRVLELGCGYGVITRQLASAQDCIVTGVERDAESAATARPWLDRLVVGDLEGTSWVEETQAPFQVILAADVIEHLRDPLDLLQQLHGLLEQEGRLILSVPNIGHAGVIAELLCGRFDYTPTGILDETHLRFFTWRSLERLLNAAGFEVIHRETVEASGSHEQFYEHWVRLPAALRDMLDRHPAARVFQYVLMARPAEHPAPLKTDDDETLQAWLAEPR